VRAVLSYLWLIGLLAGLSLAQESDHNMAGHDHSGHDMQNMPGMDMSAGAPNWMPSMHAGSGTAWEPASVPGQQWMTLRGGWDLMAHGVVFLTYNQQGGPRGVGKAESVNWLMFMEQHRLGKGTLLFREMLSAESLTSPHPGFPQIFQTGETYHGAPLVDHQHPHNVFAELSGYYSLPVAKTFPGNSTADQPRSRRSVRSCTCTGHPLRNCRRRPWVITCRIRRIRVLVW
jgi:hypothetical protein